MVARVTRQVTVTISFTYDHGAGQFWPFQHTEAMAAAVKQYVDGLPDIFANPSSVKHKLTYHRRRIVK